MRDWIVFLGYILYQSYLPALYVSSLILDGVPPELRVSDICRVTCAVSIFTCLFTCCRNDLDLVSHVTFQSAHG